MLNWLMKKMQQHARERAEVVVAQRNNVSIAYLKAVNANNEAMLTGAITPQEWIDQGVKLAYQYPRDSRIAEVLRMEEGLSS